MQLRFVPLLLFGTVKYLPSEGFSSKAMAYQRRHTPCIALQATHGAQSLLDETLVHSSDSFDDELGEDAQIGLSNLDAMEIKRRLIDLLPRMMGTPKEFKTVESYVNALEERYTPVQTLGFLNLAMSGDWQLLFSTNLSGLPKPNFRLTELYQRIEASDFSGNITNEATWDLAESGPAFDASGSFTINCSYSINQGARMVVNLEDHVLQLAKGSVLPNDVQALVGLLHRAIPTELFDPSDHAMDTTYLDGDLRIVRMTGPRFEAVRDIFIRRGSLEINPM